MQATALFFVGLLGLCGCQSVAPDKVAFSASLGLDGYYGPYNTDIVLVYTQVLTNIGSAYSPITGQYLVRTTV